MVSAFRVPRYRCGSSVVDEDLLALQVSGQRTELGVVGREQRVGEGLACALLLPDELRQILVGLAAIVVHGEVLLDFLEAALHGNVQRIALRAVLAIEGIAAVGEHLQLWFIVAVDAAELL